MHYLVSHSTECFHVFVIFLKKIQELMATISLRRIRDKVLVGLPSKTIETVSFELSEEERELYNQMEVDSRIVVGYFITANKLRSRYMSVLFSVMQLRQLCSDSALCSTDLRSLLPSDNIGGIGELCLFIFLSNLVFAISVA